MKRLVITALLALGCSGPGSSRLSIPISAIGTPARPVTVSGFTVTLTVARVGFGPLTFCASRAASPELCPNALAEWAATASIDALSPTPQPLGQVDGFTGTARSVGFAYAIPWLATEKAPTPKSGAPGGHSAHLEGTATRVADGRVVRFVADLDVRPLVQAEPAVSQSGFTEELDPSVRRLDVRFDPTTWLAQIDFDQLAASGTDVVVMPGSQANNALIVGMSDLGLPSFTWSK